MHRQAHQKTQSSDNSQHKTPGAPAVTPEPVASNQPNEGEGSRTAARRYNAESLEYIASGRAQEAAADAAKAIDAPEGEELREAEETGKRGNPRKEH